MVDEDADDFLEVPDRRTSRSVAILARVEGSEAMNSPSRLSKWRRTVCTDTPARSPTAASR